MSQITYNDSKFWLFQNDRISRELIEGNSWEPHISSLIQIFCKKDMVAIDCGANFGLFTLEMARCVGGNGKVIAFETQNTISQQLNFNIFINGLRNILVLPNAVWGKSNQILYMEAVDRTSPYVNIGGAKIVNSSPNPVLSLAIDDLQLKKCDFIKIDVQGSEVDCLLGAKKLLSELRPKLVVEIENDHLKAFGRSDEELINLLLSNKYRVGRILNSYPADHLCIPEELFSTTAEQLLQFPYQIDWIRGAQIRIEGELNLWGHYDPLEL